jgi:hypothetical protein
MGRLSPFIVLMKTKNFSHERSIPRMNVMNVLLFAAMLAGSDPAAVTIPPRPCGTVITAPDALTSSDGGAATCPALPGRALRTGATPARLTVIDAARRARRGI